MNSLDIKMVRIKYGVILKSAAVILLLWLAISYLFSSHGELEHEEKRMDNYFKKLKNNIENNIRQDRKVFIFIYLDFQKKLQKFVYLHNR